MRIITYICITQNGDIYKSKADTVHLSTAIGNAVTIVFNRDADGVRIEENGVKKAFVCRMDDGSVNIKKF